MKERNMDREAQGENSSSQNVNLEVTHTERGASGAAVRFSLSDGSSFFVHPQASLEVGINIGTCLTRGELEALLLRSAVFTARDKAAEYMARREHSAAELVLKLRKKDYDKETASDAVDMLVERGWVDDRRFASQWVESRLKKHPEGRSALLAGLAKKGVPRDLAAEAVDSVLDRDAEETALSRSLEKYVRTRSADPGKVVNHLLRRGFRYADIKRHMAGLDEYAEETGMEYNEYD